MSPRGLVTILLLAFVAVSLGVLVAREVAPQRAADPALPADGIVLYYFHGPERCPTCERLEAACRRAVGIVAAERNPSPPPRVESVNFLDPANESLRETFDVGALSVALAEIEDGRVKRGRRLDGLWDVIGDADALADYVADELRRFLEGR